FLFGGFLKLMMIDLVSWHFCENFVYNMEYSILYAGMRLLDFGSLFIAMIMAWILLKPEEDRRDVSALFGYGGLALLFLYSTLELNSALFWLLQKFQAAGVSILWTVFAIAFLSGGIWKNNRILRYTGLCLFVVVVYKVLFIDLSEMETLYRVIAFLVVGIALLMGAFAYIYASRKFIRGNEDKDIESKQDD
ncbi:MAG: DUF2339 domain-containing protein, partial [Lentisphaerae bacterium]|nr:DUF2339 domain-containing protein [Lentisphaerota bacterium]